MLSSSSIVTFRFVQLRKYSPNSRGRPPSCLLAVFAIFLAVICLVPAIVLTLETSEVSAIFAFTTKTTQPGPQVFSVKGTLTCSGLHF